MIELVRQEVLDARPFEPGHSERRFVINMTDLGELSFLPKLLKHSRQVAPAVSIESMCLDPQALLDTIDRKSTRLNSSHSQQSRMPSSA